MLYETIGNNIKHARLDMNLTQEQLAERVDISTSYIGRIERGERNLSLDILIKISNVLNIPIENLLGNSINIHNDIIFSSELSKLISKLSLNDRELILDMIKLMASHMNKS